MMKIADSSLRKLGLPIDIPDVRIVCPVCHQLVAKGVLGPGTRLQLRCRKKCKGADGKALLFPVVSLSGGIEVDSAERVTSPKTDESGTVQQAVHDGTTP